MTMIKYDKAQNAARSHRIAQLKAAREKLTAFGDLKNSTGGVALIESLKMLSKSRDALMKQHLDSEQGGDDNYKDALMARAEQRAIETVLGYIENPGAAIADIDTSIENLKELNRKAEAGELD